MLVGGGKPGAARAVDGVRGVATCRSSSSLLIAISAVLSLVTIISIYREGGILKRLRATPLRPLTILGAHVLVKLLLTALTLALMVLAGRRYYPVTARTCPLVSFALALLVSTLSILSHRLPRSRASCRPRASRSRSAASSSTRCSACRGCSCPFHALPRVLQAIGRLLPLTYAVSLLRGILLGDSWMAHAGDLAALAAIVAASAAISSRRLSLGVTAAVWIGP